MKIDMRRMFIKQIHSIKKKEKKRSKTKTKKPKAKQKQTNGNFYKRNFYRKTNS